MQPEDKKVLISPCHYVLDDKSNSSEASWVANIIHGLEASGKYDLTIIAGKNQNFTSLKTSNSKNLAKNPEIIEIYSVLPEWTLFNAFAFTLRKTFATWNVLSKKKMDVIHHMLPFGINLSFDLDFIFKKRNMVYILGPLQSPLETKEDNYTGIGQKGEKNPLFMIFQRTVLKLTRGFLAYLSRLTIARADYILTATEHTKGLLLEKKIPPEKITVINPGINISLFDFVGLEKKPQESLEIVTTGYLTKRKGVDMLIEAMHLILKKNKNISLRIIGDGPEMDNLQAQAKDISENVHFAGFVPNQEIKKIYSQAHIFVSMSKSESWGQMYLEAMAAGLVTISSQNTGSQEIIKNGETGFLIPQGGVEHLAEKILFLAENRQLMTEVSTKGRKVVEQKFDWKTVIVPKYLDLYEKATSLKQNLN